MTVFDLVASYRQKSGDYKMPDEEIVGRLRDGDAQVFHLVRAQNPEELTACLSTVYEGSISAFRPYVVLPSRVWTDAVAEIADSDGRFRQCSLFTLKDETSVALSTTFRPAAILSPGKVKFCTRDPFTSGTRQVRIAYTREPRPILFIGGLISKLTDSAYGATKNLDRATFTWPAEIPAMAEHELRGATLSILISENQRRDYTIEENEGGDLKSVYISRDYTAVDWVTPNFVGVAGEGTEVKDKRYWTFLSRTSDLPEKWHNAIVELALQPGGVKK